MSQRVREVVVLTILAISVVVLGISLSIVGSIAPEIRNYGLTVLAAILLVLGLMGLWIPGEQNATVVIRVTRGWLGGIALKWHRTVIYFVGLVVLDLVGVWLGPLSIKSVSIFCEKGLVVRWKDWPGGTNEQVCADGSTLRVRTWGMGQDEPLSNSFLIFDLNGQRLPACRVVDGGLYCAHPVHEVEKAVASEKRHVKTATYVASADQDDVDQVFSGPPHGGWSVVERSIEWVIEEERGVPNYDWSISLIAAEPLVSVRVRLQHHALGASGRLKFHIEYDLEKSLQ